ncbi:Oidioi.mRNA.OKI2018_I69.chr2.g7750.t1.cds [Oikopleura dioica]|uniref:Oidioi.mRNA.OKI2018_I69.chr2.g7750.t1.cds n=1 Tax=Oikopleura dioica TaxID=34765 RepID=A0ABN7TDQ8_OIKDI|nr:Oidioi.mRNA.OKI2018_I69.chr2.g7750.t1.cds [Oikopleura dioica]
MAESDLLRSIRLMKEKRDEKIAAREVDPITAIEKAAESRRKVLIDKNFAGPDNGETEISNSASESSDPPAAPETARKERWKEMAKQREIWDRELVEATQIAKERLQKEKEQESSEISAPSAVRKKFEVLSAKEQVERALRRSGKPDAKETPFVKRTAKKEFDLKELSQKGHVSKLESPIPEKENFLPAVVSSPNFKNFDLEEAPIMPAPIVPPRQTTPTVQTAKLIKPVSQPKLLPSKPNASEPESQPSPSSTPPPQEPAPIPFSLDERGDDSSSAISSVLQPNDVSEDAMAVDAENNLLTPKSQKRSVEAEDYQNSREKFVKQHSGHLKSRGSIDDISIALTSPQNRKLTIDDYRASQRIKDKPTRETVFNWQNQMTLKNSTAIGTLKRDEKRKDLENEIALLEQQKRQAIKAHKLIMSKTVPADVEAEAEKTLLCATEKYKGLRAIANSMKRVLDPYSKGSIRISDLWVKANKSVIANSEHFRNTWVIGLITVGEEFFATEMSRMDVQGEVRLLVEGSKGKRILRNVAPDFELSISIFSLNIAGEKKEKQASGGLFSRSLFSRKSLRKNHHSNGSGSSATCPEDSSSRFEKFIPGKVKTKGAGNTGCTTYGNWIRYWARLRGDSIEFWRYPEHAETEPAEGRISLRYLLNRSVGADKRGRRPNTFELYGRAPPKNEQANHMEGLSLSYDHNKFVRYQISADASEEMTKWCEALGTVLQELRVWDFTMSPPVDDNC